MADLVSAISILFGLTFPAEKRNHTICAVQLGLIVSSALASVYSVGLIAFDRFLYIIHGMKYQFWIYPQRTRVIIVAVWILGKKSKGDQTNVGGFWMFDGPNCNWWLLNVCSSFAVVFPS